MTRVLVLLPTIFLHQAKVPPWWFVNPGFLWARRKIHNLRGLTTRLLATHHAAKVSAGYPVGHMPGPSSHAYQVHVLWFLSPFLLVTPPKGKAGLHSPGHSWCLTGCVPWKMNPTLSRRKLNSRRPSSLYMDSANLQSSLGRLLKSRLAC